MTCLCTWLDAGTSIATSPRIVAWQPSREFPSIAVARFCFAGYRQVVELRINAVFGKFSGCDNYLAAATHRTAAAYRIEIDTEGACGVQDGCSVRKTAPFSRWGKDN